MIEYVWYYDYVSSTWCFIWCICLGRYIDLVIFDFSGIKWCFLLDFLSLKNYRGILYFLYEFGFRFSGIISILGFFILDLFILDFFILGFSILGFFIRFSCYLCSIICQLWLMFEVRSSARDNHVKYDYTSNLILVMWWF